MKRVIGTALAMAALSGPALAQDQSNQGRLAMIQAYFAEANVISGPELVDCTLSRGTETTCFKITVATSPKTYTPGPWCPTNISDGPDKGGIWFVDGETVDVDGAFITSLAEIYGDSKWKLYDETTGAVRYTGTLEGCEAAARPDVAPEYQNYCVQCLPEYMPENASNTYVIPLEPQNVWRTIKTNQTGSGLAYNGVRLDGPAPVKDILSAHTIAAFDDCGGHVNLHVGYHYHAVTDCLEDSALSTGPSLEAIAAAGLGPQIGIAMDGYPIFGNLMADGSKPEGLDKCYGTEIEGVGYHYHAGYRGSNQILGCLKAEAGCVLNSPDQVCDASQRHRGPPPGADAAKED